MSRIIICITNDIDYDRRIQRTAKTLRNNGHDVTIFCRNLHNRPGPNKLRCLAQRGFFFYAEFNIRLLIKLLLTRTDIITAVDYDTLPAATIAAKVRKKHLILDAHELYEESAEIVARPGVKWFWKRVGHAFVPRVDRAYTVSEGIAKYYTEKFKVPFKVVMNAPISKNGHFTPLLETENIIIYQGALNAGRLLELLVKIPEYLPSEYKIWILGEGDLSHHLREIAHPEVVFQSWVAPNELHDITSKAFLAFNMLERKSKSYYLSLANKFFDYIHAGVPSLNSSFPEYEKINERYNCCYTRGIQTPQELAAWIREISQDMKSYEEKRKNSFLASRELNWEKESNKLLEIYDFRRSTYI